MDRRTAGWIIIVAVFIALVAVGAQGARFDAESLGGSDTRAGYRGTVVRDDGAGSAKVAIVPLTGVIIDGTSNIGQGLVGADSTIRLLEGLERDGVDAIILEVDSPGGAVLASDEIARTVQRLSSEAGIPVVAWMRSTAASGGYYVSAHADRIIAHPSTITGSIGVILSYPNIAGLADDLGVEWVVVKSGRLKDMASIFRDLTGEERELLQSLIDEAYGDFVEVVREGRGMPERDVRAVADGRILTGRQAQEAGLVDELGTRAAAYAAAEELAGNQKLRITRYRQRLSFGDWLLLEGRAGLGLGHPAERIVGRERLDPAGTPRLEYRIAP